MLLHVTATSNKVIYISVLPFQNLGFSLCFPFSDRSFLQKIAKIPSNFLQKILIVQITLIEENVYFTTHYTVLTTNKNRK